MFRVQNVRQGAAASIERAAIRDDDLLCGTHRLFKGFDPQDAFRHTAELTMQPYPNVAAQSFEGLFCTLLACQGLPHGRTHMATRIKRNVQLQAYGLVGVAGLDVADRIAVVAGQLGDGVQCGIVTGLCLLQLILGCFQLSAVRLKFRAINLSPFDPVFHPIGRRRNEPHLGRVQRRQPVDRAIDQTLELSACEVRVLARLQFLRDIEVQGRTCFVNIGARAKTCAEPLLRGIELSRVGRLLRKHQHASAPCFFSVAIAPEISLGAATLTT